jgi:hypothetical protein
MPGDSDVIPYDFRHDMFWHEEAGVDLLDVLECLCRLVYDACLGDGGLWCEEAGDWIVQCVPVMVLYS